MLFCYVCLGRGAPAREIHPQRPGLPPLPPVAVTVKDGEARCIQHYRDEPKSKVALA